MLHSAVSDLGLHFAQACLSQYLGYYSSLECVCNAVLSDLGFTICMCLKNAFHLTSFIVLFQYQAVKTQLSQTEKSLKQHKEAMKELSKG